MTLMFKQVETLGESGEFGLDEDFKSADFELDIF